MRWLTFAMLPLGAAAPALGQSHNQPLQMAPSTAWVMDYAEDSCALRRGFKSGEDEAILELRQFGPSGRFHVTLISTTLDLTNQPPRVRFDPDDDFHPGGAPFFLDDGKTRGVLFNDTFVPTSQRSSSGGPIDPARYERSERERAITSLTVQETFRRDITLKTGEMHEPMQAMRTCLDELLTHWGFDPSVQRTLLRQAEPLDNAAWARRIMSTYPTAMLRQGRSGLVHLRLVVGPDGKPTSCIPQQYAANPDFQKHACEVSLKAARFEPALDATGSPVTTVFTTFVVYQVMR